jgi:MtN3 and saliva related transmembrane protein
VTAVHHYHPVLSNIRSFAPGKHGGQKAGMDFVMKHNMNTEQIIGIAAGVCTGTSLLPQLIKIKKEKQAGGTSAGMLIILLAGLIGWIAYGILRTDYPIIFTNTFSLVVNIWIMILSVKYKSSNKAKA